MKQAALKSYRTAETLGNTQLELILQVYDGALGAFSRASAAYQIRQMDTGYNEMEKARRFVTHLYTTLNLDDGGEVAANLARLYAFVIGEIDSVQATKDTEQLDKISSVLRNIRDGWAGLKGSAAALDHEDGMTAGPQLQTFVTSA